MLTQIGMAVEETPNVIAQEVLVGKPTHPARQERQERTLILSSPFSYPPTRPPPPRRQPGRVR